MSASSAGTSLVAAYARGGRPISIPSYVNEPEPVSRMGEVIEETHRRVGPALRRNPKSYCTRRRRKEEEKAGTWSAITSKARRLTEKSLKPMFIAPLNVIEDDEEDMMVRYLQSNFHQHFSTCTICAA